MDPRIHDKPYHDANYICSTVAEHDYNVHVRHSANLNILFTHDKDGREKVYNGSGYSIVFQEGKETLATLSKQRDYDWHIIKYLTKLSI